MNEQLELPFADTEKEVILNNLHLDKYLSDIGARAFTWLHVAITFQWLRWPRWLYWKPIPQDLAVMLAVFSIPILMGIVCTLMTITGLGHCSN